MLLALFVIVLVNNVICYLRWRIQRNASTPQTGEDGSDVDDMIRPSSFKTCSTGEDERALASKLPAAPITALARSPSLRLVDYYRGEAHNHAPQRSSNILPGSTFHAAAPRSFIASFHQIISAVTQYVLMLTLI
jgi:hypothetical protein